MSKPTLINRLRLAKRACPTPELTGITGLSKLCIAASDVIIDLEARIKHLEARRQEDVIQREGDLEGYA